MIFLIFLALPQSDLILRHRCTEVERHKGIKALRTDGRGLIRVIIKNGDIYLLGLAFLSDVD